MRVKEWYGSWPTLPARTHYLLIRKRVKGEGG